MSPISKLTKNPTEPITNNKYNYDDYDNNWLTFGD
jgi:hypothetical protein